MEVKLAITVLLMTTIQVVAHFASRAKRRAKDDRIRSETASG
jgi:hypothetical protein